ncbi:hypothetical protein VULLAG_LOCUS21951 [Vulpes lagopus]
MKYPRSRPRSKSRERCVPRSGGRLTGEDGEGWCGDLRFLPYDLHSPAVGEILLNRRLDAISESQHQRQAGTRGGVRTGTAGA